MYSMPSELCAKMTSGNPTTQNVDAADLVAAGIIIWTVFQSTDQIQHKTNVKPKQWRNFGPGSRKQQTLKKNTYTKEIHFNLSAEPYTTSYKHLKSI